MKKTLSLFLILLSLTSESAEYKNSVNNFFGTWLASDGWLKLGDVQSFPKSPMINIKNDTNGVIQSIEILASGIVYQVVRAPLIFNINDNKLYGRINGVLKAIGFVSITNNELSIFITQNGLADYANIGISLNASGHLHGVFNILGAPAGSFFSAKDLVRQSFQPGMKNLNSINLPSNGNACFVRMDFTCLTGRIFYALGWGATTKDALQQARYKALGTCNGQEYRIDSIDFSKTCTSK